MNRSVIIVGAGAAGLSAAVRLCRSGCRVRLLEKRSYPGGRAYSFMDPHTGEIVDNGQHLLAGAYRSFLGLLKELGTDDRLYYQQSLRVPFIDGGKSALLNTGALPGKAGIIWGLLRFGALGVSSKTAIIRLFLKLRSNRLEAGAETVLSLLRRERQPEEAIRNFWGPILVSALNLGIGKAAAKLFVTVMREAFFSEGVDSRLIFPDTDLGELFATAGEWLRERGSSLELNHSVKQIAVENDIVTSIRTNKEEIDDFDFVIVAVPPTALLRVMPDDMADNAFFAPLKDQKYSSIISAHYWFDRELFSDEFAAILGSRLHWVFNRRLICRYNKTLQGNYPNCLSFTISDAGSLAELSADKLGAILKSEIESVFPAAKEATLQHSRIIIEMNATPEITPESEPLRLPQTTPVSNLFLAGDWTATGLPATLEGAARSGEAAAEKILSI